MTITAFDKINRFQRRVEYHLWFEEMYLNTEQRRKREEIAEDIDDLWAIFLALFLYEMQLDIAKAEAQHRQAIEEALLKRGIAKNIVDDYIRDVVDEEMDVTVKRYKDDAYWTSPERALVIAVNDANTVMNAQEYKNAVDGGARYKTWITMQDERVRPTHVEVDSVSVPIDEPFVVGDSLMMYPRDASTFGASVSEVSNCRCSILYL